MKLETHGLRGGSDEELMNKLAVATYQHVAPGGLEHSIRYQYIKPIRSISLALSLVPVV